MHCRRSARARWPRLLVPSRTEHLRSGLGKLCEEPRARTCSVERCGAFGLAELAHCRSGPDLPGTAPGARGARAWPGRGGLLATPATTFCIPTPHSRWLGPQRLTVQECAKDLRWALGVMGSALCFLATGMLFVPPPPRLPVPVATIISEQQLVRAFFRAGGGGQGKGPQNAQKIRVRETQYPALGFSYHRKCCSLPVEEGLPVAHPRAADPLFRLLMSRPVARARLCGTRHASTLSVCFRRCCIVLVSV